MGYFFDLKRGIKTTVKGLSLTLRHLVGARKFKVSHNIQDPGYFTEANGNVTLQYPHQTLDIPENGRYQLDIEIDDCIVCDKCAKVCPVDCIDIEAIKSPELIRNASDGSPVRLYPAKFDIDMAKCCFCALCTTVCPTECLTMNGEYDYSVTDVSMLNFAFSNLSPEVAQEKRDLYEQFVKEKELHKTSNIPSPAAIQAPIKSGFQPKRPIIPATNIANQIAEKDIPKPAFTPKKPASATNTKIEENTKEEKIETAPKQSFVPKKPIIVASPSEIKAENINSKPAFVPKKPLMASKQTESAAKNTISKPAFVPKKPLMASKQTESAAENVRPKPAFVPKKSMLAASPSETKAENIISKPAFVPKKPALAKPKDPKTDI